MQEVNDISYIVGSVVDDCPVKDQEGEEVKFNQFIMPTIHYVRRADMAQLGIKLLQSRSEPPVPRANEKNCSTNTEHDHDKQADKGNPAKQDSGPARCETRPLSSTSSQYISIQKQRLPSDRIKDNKEKYHADAAAPAPAPTHPTLSLLPYDDELKHGGAELLDKNKTETLTFQTSTKHQAKENQGEQRKEKEQHRQTTNLIYVKIGNTEHPAFELADDDAPAATAKGSNSVWVKWVSNGKKECVFRHQIVPDGLQAQRKRKQPDYYHNQNSSSTTVKKSSSKKKNGCEERSRSKRSGGVGVGAEAGAGGVGVGAEAAGVGVGAGAGAGRQGR